MTPSGIAGTASANTHANEQRTATDTPRERRLRFRFSHCYLIASGFTGDPTAPVIGSAGATNKNS